MTGLAAARSMLMGRAAGLGGDWWGRGKNREAGAGPGG